MPERAWGFNSPLAHVRRRAPVDDRGLRALLAELLDRAEEHLSSTYC